jgi:hypothetical protein
MSPVMVKLAEDADVEGTKRNPDFQQFPQPMLFYRLSPPWKDNCFSSWYFGSLVTRDFLIQSLLTLNIPEPLFHLLQNVSNICPKCVSTKKFIEYPHT